MTIAKMNQSCTSKVTKIVRIRENMTIYGKGKDFGDLQQGKAQETLNLQNAMTKFGTLRVEGRAERVGIVGENKLNRRHGDCFVIG